MLGKKITAVILTVVMAAGMTGCGNTLGNIKLGAVQEAVYIQKDGGVSYAVMEKFDKDYYNKNDLEEAVKQEVDNYNKSDSASTKDALKLKKMKTSKKVSTMVLEFATVEDFSEYITKYNAPEEGTFYIGKIEDNDECKITGKFYVPGDKKKVVAEDKIEDMDANILIVGDAMNVQIDGMIEYVSENCVVDDKGIVKTASADEGISYIIYTEK